jgi:predicted acyl esterase
MQLKAAASEADVSLTRKGTRDIHAKFEPPTEAFDHLRMEVMIPMRDRVQLYTLVMIPTHSNGALPNATAQLSFIESSAQQHPATQPTPDPRIRRGS